MIKFWIFEVFFFSAQMKQISMVTKSDERIFRTQLWMEIFLQSLDFL